MRSAVIKGTAVMMACLLLANQLCLATAYDQTECIEQDEDVAVEELKVRSDFDMGLSTQRNPIPFDYSREAQYEFLKNWQDPNYITDQNLFGQYDSQMGSIAGGYLDYQRFPEMEPVKEAVENGNYELAKEELLEYYRAKMAKGSAVVYKYDSFSGNDLLSAYIAEYDLCWNENSGMRLLDVFTIGKDKDWYSIDLMSNINDMIAGDRVSVYLVALKKDGSVAQFDSINSGTDHAPYMEVTIDGVTQRLLATDDTYVSPRENHKNIYGAQPVFMVEESVSSIGVGRDANFKSTNVAVDKDTKRGYLKFDISSIPNDAKVTNLSIKLFGSNVGTEGNTEDMEIVAFKIPNNSWCEGGIDAPNGAKLGLSFYSSVNPITNSQGQFTGTETIDIDHAIFSYYGEGSYGYVWGRTYDTVSGGYGTSYRYHEDLLRMSFFIPHFPRLYNASKEDNQHYAAIGIRQWAGFLEERGHTDKYTHQLDFSVRGRAIVYALKYLIQSVHMTPDIWAASVKYMWLSGNVMASNTFTNNNVRTFQAAGLAAVNGYFNEFKQHYTWAEHLRMLTSTNMDYLIKPDGSNREGAVGYAVYALDDMLSWINPNNELNLTDVKSAALEGGLEGERGQLLNKGFMYLLNTLGPGYVDNQMGDGSSYRNSFMSVLQRGYDALKNPYLLYAVTKGKQGMKNPVNSIKYDGSKSVVMRSGHEKNDLYLYSDVTPNTSHVHSSQNQAILFAYGNYLLTDQLFYTYTSSSNPSSTYLRLRGVRMHNTVEINNASETATGITFNSAGTVNNWTTNNAFDISNLTTPWNSAALHTRNIIFVKPGFFIVSDYLTPRTTGSKNYKQHWHMLPESRLTIDTQTGIARTNFKDAANIIVATVGSDDIKSSIVPDGLFSEGTGSIISNVNYLRYEQNSENAAVYDTLLIPEKFGDNITVENHKLELENITDNGATAMEFTIRNHTENTLARGVYYLLHDKKQKETRNFGDYGTDADFAYVERDKEGKLSSILMQNGDRVYSNEDSRMLIKATKTLADIGVNYSTGTIEISSEKESELNNLTVFTDRDISVVRLNGKTVSFKVKGSYIYFDQPIIDDESGPKPTIKPTSPPTHGSGGWGGSGGLNGGISGGIVSPTPTATSIPTQTSTPLEPDKETPVKPFHDLNDAKWAEEYINGLAELGIVHGDENSNFNPNKKIKREEFAKIIALAMLFSQETDVELPFKDISPDNWAYPYIVALYKQGIIQGISEDTFGFGEYITREDMIVMAVRALEKLNLKPPQDIAPVTGFSDWDRISYYALDSVAKLQKYGVLEGSKGGSGEQAALDPQNPATRAECSKIVYMLIRKINP